MGNSIGNSSSDGSGIGIGLDIVPRMDLDAAGDLRPAVPVGAFQGIV